jgi:hypothetical protein
MAIINHTVEQIAPDLDSYTKFEGLQRLDFKVVLPDSCEPFPANVRNGYPKHLLRTLEMHGLLHVCHRWHINGPVRGEWTISTMVGPITVPGGTRIISEEVPSTMRAIKKPASLGKRIWD